ncbi:MAG: hypothetical protein LBT11_03900 [Treponema sp.]|jgi:hypothetical protein|nr:hypothetical protein [Treponema sp.]
MIDRRALLGRHQVRYTGDTPGMRAAPLSVGNGRFCFTADYTGLQTLFDQYRDFPLCTMADWGWHSYPGAPRDSSALRLRPFESGGRMVGYPTDETGQEELFKGLRQNAHKFHLGKIAFDLAGAAATAFEPLSQRLDLWQGILFSEFSALGERVKVETFVHPELDMLCIRVESPLIAPGRLRLRLSFPYGSHKKNGADFGSPERHSTRMSSRDARSLSLEREMDASRYRLTLEGFDGTAAMDGPHEFLISGRRRVLELCIRFEKAPSPGFTAGFTGAREACTAFWARYWEAGGALDLSASEDRRAGELERRIVLSQYLTAIQSRSPIPPAETGLTCNSWYGKFHLEMTYWHWAHFALWGRAGELERGLSFYKRILPQARKLAASQGYAGARWPKMCDPTGDPMSPSSIAPLLVWQQPHPIMLADLCRRAMAQGNGPGKGREKLFLEEYRDVVQESAAFMLSFIRREGDSLALGPPIIPVQERHDPNIVLNPAFELEYFRWALGTAGHWLEGLGEPVRGDFLEAAARLRTPAMREGLYLAHENCPASFTELPFYTDHPSMLAMLGVLPGIGIDRKAMSATLDKVLAGWERESFWGWDFPMMAMTALRLGRREEALDILLMESPKNTYLANGHNAQVGSDALPLYLPGNGGLLLAAALMAESSGNGAFRVESEGLSPYYI